jgi:hypothetical protein
MWDDGVKDVSYLGLLLFTMLAAGVLFVRIDSLNVRAIPAS